MENLSPLPIPDLDRTFSVETSEEVKQPKKENESPKMLDSNNNSPNVLSTNLPVPTMRVLPSTPNKEIFPPGTPRFRAKQETKGDSSATELFSTNLLVPTMRILRSTPKKETFLPGTPKSQAKQETNGSAMATKEYSFQLGDPVWAKIKGFSAWPGKIEMPPEHLKRPITKKVMHCVFFFGSYNYGWLQETDLKPYFEFKSEMNTTKKSVKKAIDEINAYIKDGCKTNAATIVAMSKAAVVTTFKDQSERDKVICLKQELNATRIRCEELLLKDTHVQIRLSKLLDENTGLKVDNLEHQRRIAVLLQSNEEKDAEIEDQKTQISSFVKTIQEGGAARGGPPKKGRKSVNFKVPPKGAQSSKAMGRSQFNHAKINHGEQDSSLWINKSIPNKRASAERANLQKLLPASLRKPKLEIEELRNPAPNFTEVTVPATKASLLRAQVNINKKTKNGK